MRTFAYRAFTTGGESRRGLLEAGDAKEARERLIERGLYPERIHAAGEREIRGFGRVQRFGLPERAMFYRELGSLITSGLPLERALGVLIDSPELEQATARIASVRDQIREGAALGHALQAMPGRISPFESAVVQAGERAGTLGDVLNRLAAFLEEQDRIRDRVQSALIYPMIVVGMAVAVAVLMLGVMIPRIGSLLSEANIELPLLTRAFLALSNVLLPVLLALVILAGVGITMIRGRYRSSWKRTVFRLPLIGSATRCLVTLRFSRTLAMLLDGGVPLVEGVVLAGQAAGNPHVTIEAEVASEEVRHGRSLSDVLRGMTLLMPSLAAWVQAGEAGGSLVDMLNSAATRYEQQWERFVTRGLSVLEPALIVLVGGFVMLVALAILMPVLSLNRLLL